MSEINDSIIEVLEKRNEPVTYSYINTLLPRWDFGEISVAVDRLKASGFVQVGIEGVSLTGAPILALDENQSKLIGVPESEAKGLLDLGHDILIGDSRPKNPKDFAQISEEELEELISSIGNGPNALPYSGEKTIGAEPDGQDISNDEEGMPIESNAPTDAILLHRLDSPNAFDLSNRTKNALKLNGLLTIGDIIRQLDRSLNMRGLGAKSKAELIGFLTANARRNTSIATFEQMQALHCLSNNDTFFFDAFGTLSRDRDEKSTKGRPMSKPNDRLVSNDEWRALSIDVLEIRDATARCFKRNGITTIEDLVSVSDNQLLQLHGIGMGKVKEVRDALSEAFDIGFEDIARTGLGSSCSAIDADAYSNYVESFPQEGVSLLSDCAKELAGYGVNVYLEAFIVSFLPLASEALNMSDGDSSTTKELVLEVITESKIAIETYKASFRSRLDYAKAKERMVRDECPVTLPENGVWRTLALEVAEGFEGCCYEKSAGLIKFDHPSLQDWLDVLPERDSQVILLRLRGFTLEKAGKRLGVTRERIRQIEKKAFEGRPLLAEDVYRYFYQTYDVSEGQFSLVTGLDSKVGRYLNLTTDKKVRNHEKLSKALSDERVPESVKKKIRVLLNENYVFVDGERVRKDRRSIILYLANRLTERSGITMNDLFGAYERFLEEHSLKSKKLSLGVFHNFQEYSKRKVPEILNVKNGGGSFVRYYDASQYDYSKLKEFFVSGIFEDIDCSAALIFNHPQATEIIQELDIRDEYELHYIAKKYCDLPDSITFRRMPTIVFGDGDRDRQVLDLIQEYGPIDAVSLAELYREKYGVSEDTFKGSYLNGFEFCKSHGVYSCSLEEMTPEQLDTLASLLTDKYHPMSLIKLRFKDKCPGVSGSLINKLNLEKVGYRPSYELLMRMDLDEEELFECLIDKNASFGPDTAGFCIELFKHPIFDGILKSRINSLDVIEYEKGRFIHLDSVVDALDEDVTKDDFRDYIEKVLDYPAKNEPFSICSLGREGFRHPVEDYVDEVGFGVEFLESLVATAFVGGKVKRTTVNERCVFCKTPYGFSVVDLFEYALTNLKRIEIGDLCDYMRDRYGVDVSYSRARSIVNRSDLYFYDDLDMVFESVEEYDKMIQEVLARK